MDDSLLENRLVKLEGARFAQGLALRYIIAQLWSDPKLLSRHRDRVCQSIERLYEAQVNRGGHETLQFALEEIEALFDRIPFKDEPRSWVRRNTNAT